MFYRVKIGLVIVLFAMNTRPMTFERVSEGQFEKAFNQWEDQVLAEEGSGNSYNQLADLLGGVVEADNQALERYKERCETLEMIKDEEVGPIRTQVARGLTVAGLLSVFCCPLVAFGCITGGVLCYCDKTVSRLKARRVKKQIQNTHEELKKIISLRKNFTVVIE